MTANDDAAANWTVTIKDGGGVVRFIGQVADEDRDYIRIDLGIGESRAEVAVSDMLARASIGPDSERIRELEAEVERLTTWLKDEGYKPEPWRGYGGLTPGPDDIVVSREIAESCLVAAEATYNDVVADHLTAALSQPHPAQEQQT